MSEMIEVEEINRAQRELDLRKADLMLRKIDALEDLVASPEYVSVTDQLRALLSGMVEGATRNQLSAVLTSMGSITMTLQFEKSNYEKVLAQANQQTVVAPPAPPAEA